MLYSWIDQKKIKLNGSYEVLAQTYSIVSANHKKVSGINRNIINSFSKTDENFDKIFMKTALKESIYFDFKIFMLTPLALKFKAVISFSTHYQGDRVQILLRAIFQLGGALL